RLAQPLGRDDGWHGCRGNLAGDSLALGKVRLSVERRPPLLDRAGGRRYIPGLVPTTRLFADRRHGVDRRAVPRRLAVGGVGGGRRRVVGGWYGAERGSTRARRGRAQRNPSVVSPGDHL